MAYKNFFVTRLYTDIGASDTTITLETAPTATSGRLVLEARNATQREIIKYTGVSGNDITGVTRGQGGTTAKSHLKNALVEMNLTAEDIQDLYDAFASFSSSNGSGWLNIPQVPTVIAQNGQKETVLRYSGVDLTTTINEGTKVKAPRTGTTPTTSMGFVAASSQYATKASPLGLNAITTAFTCEASVNMKSYTAGHVVSRRDSTNGWWVEIDASGRVIVTYASAGNYTSWMTYQSLQLNKWAHIAASVTSIASKTLGGIYIDGVSVPVVNAANNATTITHTGNLTIGAYSAGPSNYFDGQLAGVRVWSTARTAAEIRDNMNQETPASTTGLIAHFKGNGSWNDSSTNANHLTAVGGAINNFASHPYSATEYAIVTKVSYTGGNTDVTVFTGSGCLPNETLGATSYSTARAPFGFPSGAKWSVSWLHLVDTTGGFSAGQWSNLGAFLVAVPTGSWKFSAKGQLFASSGASVPNPRFSFSTSASSETNRETTIGFAINQSNQTTKPPFAVSPRPLEVSAMTTYYPIICSTDNAGSAGLASAISSTVITLECAYL